MLFEKEMQIILRRIRPGLIGINSNPARNLAVLVDELKANPKWLEQVQKDSVEFLSQQSYVSALTESGMMTSSNFFTEIFQKIEYKFLPKEMGDKDFLAFLARVFDAVGVSDWMEKIDEEQIGDLLAQMVPDGEKLLTEVAPQLFQALEILSLRLAYLGVESDIASRLRDRPELERSFLAVQRDLQKLLDGHDQDVMTSVYGHLERCREAIRYIRSKRDRDGISLGLTFRLMRIQELSIRMQRILEVLQTILGEWNRRPLARLVKEILVAETARFEVGPFISRHISLLAYQITEHTGRAGEHYITSTRSEYADMFRSAALGGGIIALLVIAKAILSQLPFAPGPMTMIFGILYAAGFLVILSVGGTLASKQPAMTASRIAAALDEAKSSEQAMFNLCEMIVRTIRSQLIALLGNFLVAFPVAFLICFPFMAFRLPLISAAKAEHLLHDLHPFHTLSFWYAGLAGCCLFLSGIFAGAANNWFVFNHVGRRLQNSKFLKSLVAPHNLKRAIGAIEHNIGSWVGNASLGFMLAGMGMLGVILGLPLDIRHVTFSSGQLGVAVANSSLNSVDWSTVALTGAGVFIIGLINLGVSFSLTLWVTMKSRRIRFSQTRELIRLCFARFRHRPLDFFFPPGDLSSGPSH